MREKTNLNKTGSFKKLFIKICRIFGYELIDQGNFHIPTQDKLLNENISIQGKKSINLPLGEVQISRKVKALTIIFRSCTNVNMLTQNKKRLFDQNKSEYTFRSLNSIIIPLIFSIAYVYIIYQIFLLDASLLEVFKLYISLDDLYTVFATENFLLIYWLHFLALNLFLGSWTSRDAFKHNIPRKLVSVPLVLIYFTGPIGIVLYWMFRIFYAKKIGLHD